MSSAKALDIGSAFHEVAQGGAIDVEEPLVGMPVSVDQRPDYPDRNSGCHALQYKPPLTRKRERDKDIIVDRKSQTQTESTLLISKPFRAIQQ